jgi:selenocysteine lyase/cysteine desulfurase
MDAKDESHMRNEMAEAYAELERAIYSALETYSNVHRGSGHNSVVTTQLYEQAREIVLEYLQLNKSNHTVIFCTPRRAASLMAKLAPDDFQCLASQDFGLSIGTCALAIKNKALPKGIPAETGGGTARLMSQHWVIWAGKPDKFEAGTPAIINVIAFAKALRLAQRYGKEIFKGLTQEPMSASDILYNDELQEYRGHELLEHLRKTLIGQGILVPTMEGDTPFINLDNSASTPTFVPVWNAFRQAWCQPVLAQKEIIREVKAICAGVLNAPQTDYEVVFNSNTTEAINLVAESLTLESDGEPEPVVLSTLLEHSSNDLPWRMIPGCSLLRVTVNKEGFIDLIELETLLRSYNELGQYGKKRIKLMAVSGASNVLGICNNLEEISRIVHLYGARLLVDGAQLVAHRKVDMEGCNIDYLAFSAHKVYAPFGCGVLVSRKGMLSFNPAEMQLIQSSGEANAGGIAALGKALVLLQRIGMDLIQQDEQALTARALQGMAKISGLILFGIKDPTSSQFDHKIGVIAFILKSMMSNKVGNELALHGGIGIRYGCHCAHIITKRILNIPPFLEQFQRMIVALFPKIQLPGVARVSLGIENTAEEVDRLIVVLNLIAKGKKEADTSTRGTPLFPREKVKEQMAEFVKAAAERVFK